MQPPCLFMSNTFLERVLLCPRDLCTHLCLVPSQGELGEIGLDGLDGEDVSDCMLQVLPALVPRLPGLAPSPWGQRCQE